RRATTKTFNPRHANAEKIGQGTGREIGRDLMQTGAAARARQNEKRATESAQRCGKPVRHKGHGRHDRKRIGTEVSVRTNNINIESQTAQRTIDAKDLLNVRKIAPLWLRSKQPLRLVGI